VLPLLLLIAGIGAVAWLTGRARASRLAVAGGGTRDGRLHSVPAYHGAWVALWAVLPALLFLLAWRFVSEPLAMQALLDSGAAARLPADPMTRGAVIEEARALADGSLAAAFNPLAAELAPAYQAASDRYAWIGAILALVIAFAGGALAFTRVRPDFRARTRVERAVMLLLALASLVAVLTTFGIVFSLLFESFRFFSVVNPIEFLTGTRWSPENAVGSDAAEGFGAVPLFWGTIFIGAVIAMIVAVPLGLMSAIYLTQYAHRRARAWLKPALEILAGVPTVVYGYFAALTVAPAVRGFGASLGIPSSSESALAAGLVMGIMIIPFVSSMADDALNAVPGAMRDGSLALGATPSETIRKVLIPAALPGVVGGVLLAVSRAIGETMIVVMAAGLAANLTANPFESVTTVTTQIVMLLTGDQEFDSPKTLAAFGLGLVLFLVTLALNIAALRVVKKYREAYD
jgi:phosphate transport system permease protein